MNNRKQYEEKTNFAFIQALKNRKSNVTQSMIDWYNNVASIDPNDLKAGITLTKEFLKLGYDPRIAAEQLKYVSDLQAYDSLDRLVRQNEQLNTGSLGIETHTLESSEPWYFRQEVAKLENNGSLADGALSIEEGFLIITLPQYEYLENNIIFRESNEQIELSITVDYNAGTYIYTIIQLTDNKTILTLTVDWDVIDGLYSLSTLENRYQHLLHFIKTTDSYNVSGIQVKINVNDKTTELVKNGEVTISVLDAQRVFSPLPANIQLASTLVSLAKLVNDPLTYHVGLQDYYVYNRVNSIRQTLLEEFNRKYTHDVSDGLYGQSSIVAISTLTESLKTVVRNQNNSYSLKTGEQSVVTILPEVVPKYTLDASETNTCNLFGQACCGISTGEFYQGIPTSVKPEDYPKLTNYAIQDGQCSTGFSLANNRLIAYAGLITKTREDGITIDLPYFVECESTYDDDFRANYALTGYVSGIEPDGIDMIGVMSTNSSGKIQLWGSQILIGSNNDTYAQNTVGNELSIYNGAKGSGTLSRTYFLVIPIPDILSTSGSMNATVQWEWNGVDSGQQPRVMNLRTLQFGDGTEKVCYRTQLFEESDTQEILIGTEFKVPVITNTQVAWTEADDQWKLISTARTTNPYGCIDVGGFGLLLRTVQKIEPSTNKISIQKQFYQDPYNVEFTWVNEDGENTGRLPSNTAPFINGYNTHGMKYIYGGILQLDSRLSAINPVTVTGMIPIFDASMNVIYKGTDENPGLYKKQMKYLNYDGKSPVQTINDYNFRDYDPPATGQINLPSSQTISAVIKSQTIKQWMIKLTSISFSGQELTLPEGTMNQEQISESVLKLQQSVNILQNYASYLTYYVQNIDKRLIYINNALNQVIDAVNKLANPKQPETNGWAIAGTILNFIGQGVGMFFPLVGMAVTIVGLVVTGIGAITNGDILAGVIDLAFAGVLTGIGAYKLTKRMRIKYGSTSQTLLNNKHNLNSIREEIGTNVQQEKIANLVRIDNNVSRLDKNNVSIKTTNITNANESEIEFTTGTLITPAIKRAKLASIVTQNVPEVDVNRGRATLTTNRVTSYTRANNAYSIKESTSVVNLNVVNPRSENKELKVVQLKDSDVVSLTDINLTTAEFVALSESVIKSKSYGSQNTVIGIDSDVLAGTITRVGYPLAEPKVLNKEWTTRRMDGLDMKEQYIGISISPKNIFEALNPNYQSKDGLQVLLRSVMIA